MTTTWYNFATDIQRAQRAALLRYGLRPIDEPDVEPISLILARQHLRVDTFGSPPESADDDWIETIGIPAAREYCELDLGRALAARTMELATDSFPGYAATTPPGASFVLPFGPVRAVTSITYADSDNVDQVIDSANYELDPYGNQTRLILAYGATWPSALSRRNSVRVRYVVGYDAPGTASPVAWPLPKLALAAMLLMLGHLYENREATTDGAMVELPIGVQARLDLLPRERLGVA